MPISILLSQTLSSQTNANLGGEGGGHTNKIHAAGHKIKPCWNKNQFQCNDAVLNHILISLYHALAGQGSFICIIDELIYILQ